MNPRPSNFHRSVGLASINHLAVGLAVIKKRNQGPHPHLLSLQQSPTPIENPNPATSTPFTHRSHRQLQNPLQPKRQPTNLRSASSTRSSTAAAIVGEQWSEKDEEDGATSGGAPSFGCMPLALGSQSVMMGIRSPGAHPLKPSSDKMESVMLVKRIAMDSLSRIPSSPEEMYSARSEKEVHRSGDMHATSKAGGSQSAKIPSVSSKLRQDKTDHIEVACEQRVQRLSRDKAECREKVGVSRSPGEHDIQIVDGQSGKTPLRFLFQKLKKSKKKGIKQKFLFVQQTDREGMEIRDKSVGPILAGLSNLVDETAPIKGALT
ncbi:hypothetical protein Ancab_025550 [Ancistrocladus abbreviatus]